MLQVFVSFCCFGALQMSLDLQRLAQARCVLAHLSTVVFNAADCVCLCLCLCHYAMHTLHITGMQVLTRCIS